MVRLEHAAAVTSSAGLRTNLSGNVDQYEPVADFITLAPELPRGQAVPFTLAYPLRSAELPSLHIDGARRVPGDGQCQRHPRLRRTRPPRRHPLPASCARCATRARGRLRRRHADVGGAARHLQTRSADHVVAAGGPATAGGRRARYDDARAVDRRRSRDVAGAGRQARHAAVGGRLRHQPASRLRRRAAQRDVPGRRPRPAGHRQRDDGRLRRQRRPRRRAWHTDASGHGPGRRGRLAQSAQGAGTADVRGGHDVFTGRPRRAAAGRRWGSERDRHQRRRRHRRPDSGCQVDPRRHPGRRRPADRARRRAVVGAGTDGRDRRRERRRSRLRHRRAGDRRRPASAVFAAVGGRAVRPDRWRRAGRRGHRSGVAVVPGPVAGHPGQTRFCGGSPPGRAGLAAVARPAQRRRAAHSDPGAAAGLEPAARRCAGDTHRGGLHHSRWAGRGRGR